MLTQFLYSFICISGLFSAFLMILTTQPIIRLALIIKIFVKSAFILVMLDYYFLGLTFIIVYVGAIAILFLFVIMMSEVNKDKNNSKEIKINYSLSNNNILLNKNVILRLPLNLVNHNITFIENKIKLKNSNYLTQILAILLLILFIINVNSFDNSISSIDIWNYFNINYSSEFISFTDIQSLGFLLFLGFPVIIVYLGIILWVVLIGILRISK
jgi:NADH-ubiquinone oxidoreductase chain 6